MVTFFNRLKVANPCDQLGRVAKSTWRKLSPLQNS